MQYAQRITFVIWFTIGIVTVNFNWCIAKELEYKERTYTMKSGTFRAKDNSGASIDLVWQQVDLKTARLNELLKDASEIFAQTYVAMELQFARKHPGTVASEMFLKPIEPLFKDGVEAVDWQQAKETLYTNLVQFFSTTDFAQYTKPGEQQFFVKAQDAKTGDVLGVIQFLIAPDFQVGTVKVAMFGVASQAQGPRH